MVDRCTEWTGARNGDGYPVVRIGGVLQLAHRVAYRLHVGPIPRGHEVEHLCGCRASVDPAHLEAVTHAENMRRAHARRRGEAA